MTTLQTSTTNQTTIKKAKLSPEQIAKLIAAVKSK